MKKLLLGLVTVLACTAVASAAVTAFDLGPDVVIPVGTSADIWVSVVGADNLQGCDLFLGLSGPFDITGMSIVGTVWELNNSGPYIDFTDPKSGILMVTTAAGTVPVDGALASKLAKVTITATADGAGVLTTEGVAPSDVIYPILQDSIQLSTPEPVTALLLLAGLPLLRRRHA